MNKKLETSLLLNLIESYNEDELNFFSEDGFKFYTITRKNLKAPFLLEKETKTKKVEEFEDILNRDYFYNDGLTIRVPIFGTDRFDIYDLTIPYDATTAVLRIFLSENETKKTDNDDMVSSSREWFKD